MTTARELKLAAALISGSMIASRILGFVREVVMATLLGAGPETDAYLAAFFIPDLINHFLAGGAITAALLPIFARRLVNGHEEQAWRLVATVIQLTLVVLSIALIAGWFFAEPLIAAWYDGFDEAQVALTTRLTRIVLPGPILFTVGAIFNATEQARKRFIATAIAPLVYNICIILGGVLGHASIGVEGFSWGVIVGAALGPFLVPIIAARSAIRWVPALPWTDADAKRFFWNAAPILFSSSLLFFDEQLIRRFASSFEAGALTWLNNARRLMLLPALIVGQAIGQAAFPFLARMLADARLDEARATLRGLLRATTVLSVVAAVATSIAAGPAVATVFERGAYTHLDATTTAALLAILAAAIPAWALYTVALKGLHAAEQMWLTAAIGLGSLPPAWWAFSYFAQRSGVEGIAVASVLSMSAATAAMLIALGRHYERSPWAPIGRGALEGAALSAAGAGAWFGVQALLPAASAPLALIAGGTAFGVVALCGLYVLPGPAGDAVRRRLKRR